MLRGTTRRIAPRVAAFPFEGEGVAPATDEGGRAALTFAPNIFGTTPLSPTCHLRANDFVIAAHRVQRRTRQPNSAAQSNPAPLAGRQQAGSPLLRGTTRRIAPRVAAFPFEGEGVAPATDEGGRAALTFAPNIFGTTPLSPTCHLRANDFVIAAHRVQRRTRQPNSAAQSNPAPLAGRQQAGSPLLRGTT